MASEYDGSIKLGVQFDATSIKSSAKELKKSLEDSLSAMDDKKLDKNLASTAESMRKLVNQTSELEQKISKLEDAKIPTDDYKEVSDQIERANKKFNDLLYKQQEMQRQGKDHGKAWDALSDKIDEVGNEIRYAEGELQDLVDTGKAFKLGSETSEYDKNISKLDDINSRMRVMKQRTEEQQVAQLKASKGWKAAGVVLGTLGNDIKKLLGHLKQLALNLAKAVKNSVINGFKKLGKAVLGVGKNAASSEFSFKRLFRTMLAYGLGINTITSLFSKLRNYIAAGLDSFKDYEGGLNTVTVVMNEFQTSLQYLQNSLAAAFAPILTTVMPILTGFIDRMAQAVQSVGAFFSALQGASTFTKALRTPFKSKEAQNQEKADIKAENKANQAAAKDELKQRKADYKKQVADFKALQKERNKEIREAESSNKQITKNNAKVQKNTDLKNLNTKAIKANTNALKKQKGELAGFDDLDVLGEEVDDTNSLQSLVAVPPELVNSLKDLDDTLNDIPEAVAEVNEAFEEADIPDWIKNLAQKIKDFIAQNDWYGLGQFLGEKFNGLLKTVDDWINNVLRPEGVKWAGRIAELLNGLVAGIDWELLGKTVADGINAIFDIVNTFLTTFDFLAFGQAIGTGIKSWFENIDWPLIGQTFANKWNALFHTIEGIVTTPGLWATIGTSIAAFLRNAIETIDINSLATIFIALFNGIFEMVKTFLDALPFQGLSQKIYNGLNRVIHEIDWAGAGQTLSNLVVQLLDVFMNVAENTDWEGFGQAIGTFLENIDWAGILGRVASILWQVFSGIISGLFSTNAGKVFLAIVAGIEELKIAFALGANLLLPAIQKVLIEKLAALLVTEGFSGIFTACVGAVSGAFTSILGIVTSMGGTLVGAISGILTTITGVIQAALAFLLSPQGLIIAAIAAAITLAIVLIVNNWDKISTFLSNCGKWLVDLFNKLPKFVQDVLKAVGNLFINWVNGIIAAVELFANVIISAVNNIISALNALMTPLNTVLSTLSGGGISLQIPTIPQVSLPRIPALAQGAVIPPNKQFLAMLGDQTEGTNIEAPLDTIVDAFREVVGSMQTQNTAGNAEMTLDGQVFARLITPYVLSELHRVGYDVTVLEG